EGGLSSGHAIGNDAGKLDEQEMAECLDGSFVPGRLWRCVFFWWRRFDQLLDRGGDERTGGPLSFCRALEDAHHSCGAGSIETEPLKTQEVLFGFCGYLRISPQHGKMPEMSGLIFLRAAM